MKFRQFKITEAPGDSADFKASLEDFYTTLTKKDPKDGFFANNARKNENMRLVAQFAQDNDLQSMLNPLTGKSYKFAADNDPGAGPPQAEEANMDMAALERLADVGGLTPGVMEKLGNEMLDAKSGKAGLGGRSVSSLFGIKDPEHAAAVQNILAKQAAATKVPSADAEPADAGTQAQPVSAKGTARDKAVQGSMMGQYYKKQPGGVAGRAPTPEPSVDAADAGTPTKTKTPAPAAKSKAPYSMGTPGGGYKIKSGDTLSAIAKKAGTTVDAIMKANPNIKDANRIAAGGALNMPGASKPTGDTTGDGPSPAELKPGAGDTTGDGPSPAELKPGAGDITGDEELDPNAGGAGVPKTPVPDLPTGGIGTGDVERATPDQEKEQLEKWKAEKAARKKSSEKPVWDAGHGSNIPAAPKVGPAAPAKVGPAAPKETPRSRLIGPGGEGGDVEPATPRATPKATPKLTPTYRGDSGNVLPGGKGKDVRPPEQKQPPKIKKADPNIGSMIGAGYDGTTRLKYLAGIKE